MVREIVMMLAMLLAVSQVFAAEPAALKTEQEKMNYSLGVNLANLLKQQGADIDFDILARGLKDSLEGKKLLLTDEEIGRIIHQYQITVKQRRAQLMAKQSDDNRKAGEAFLVENSKKEGVRVLPSGLQYKVIKEGSGKRPAEKDRVECHYRGTFIGGAEFDSSRKSGVPGIFGVSEVIAGWREALQLMPVGSTWQIFVPSRLAYGERGKPGSVGPNMTLIFEIELLGIK